MSDVPSQSPPRWTIRDHPGLFDGLRAQALAALQATLARALDKADSWVADCLRKAPQYPPLVEAAVALQQSRASFEQAYLDHLRQGFMALLEQVMPEQAGQSALGLVDNEELEGMLASEAMVDALNAAHELPLDTLARRFAAMAGVEVLRPAFNPVTAERLAGALQAAQRAVPLPDAVRGPLFKIYEREMIATLGTLVSSLNARLARAGILPNLDRPGEWAPDPDEGKPPLAPQQVFVPEQAPGVDVREEFDALRGLLQRRRPAEAPAPVEDFGGLLAPSLQRCLEEPEIVAVLSLMQPNVPASVLQALSDSGAALAELIKQEVLQNVGRIGLDPDQVMLARDHEDAIDLVGMLFGVLFEEREFNDRPRDLLARLVIPFTKAAVMDLRMFQYTSHPARGLLNALAEALEGNRGEVQQERGLLEKVEALVAELLARFNLSISIFARLDQDFRAYLARHQMRLELAERRASELQRGQERLENARRQTARELRARVEGRVLPGPLQEFLSQPWAHHAAIVLLRQGEASPDWRATLKVADRLLALLSGGRDDSRLIDSVLATMRTGLLAVLQSSGITGAAADDVLSGLAASFGKVAAPAMPAPASPDARVADAPAAASAAETIVALLDASDDEAAMRALQVGDWIELIGDDRKSRPVKLSWVSPISNRMLFVNRHGVRMLVASLEEMVAMKKKGELALRQHGQLFDQAMARVKSRLEAELAGVA